MMYKADKRLFIFLEGPTDARFFNSILKPKFEEKYSHVQTVEYSGETNEWISGFLNSIDSMGADYIFVADINSTPCITEKKQKIKEKRDFIDMNKVIVVKKEIESWYLSGIDATAAKKLKLTAPSFTDDVSKEKFRQLMPSKFISITDFMIEMLNNFCIEQAKQKNGSFKYFIDKYSL